MACTALDGSTMQERLRPWSALRTLRGAVERLPLVRAMRMADYERRFPDDVHACRGVYRSFDEARRSAPQGRPTGWNVPEVAGYDFFVSRVDRTFSYDYPVLFWLRPLLLPGSFVFDFGGHVGVHFYAYQRYLTFPTDLRWLVCEVPEVVKAGVALAAERGARGLAFTGSTDDASGSDVFLASGVLQCIEAPSLAELLTRLPRLPAHLLLNKLSITDGEPFVTLTNGGPHFPPIHVFNRESFIDSVHGVGYELVDTWEDHSHRLDVPFHPERRVPWFSGLYFRRAD